MGDLGSTAASKSDAGQSTAALGAEFVPVRPVGPGDRVDRFVLLEELGSGGMGVVFLAYDPQLDRKVALKVLRRREAESTGEQRLVREAQALAKLSHPNVVVVHEVGTTDDGVFIAMEHVPGDTLLRWMQSAHDWQEVAAVFIAAGRGLVAAHRAGLVHRDFKPANVLMGEDARRPRVVDFGLARPPAPSTDAAPVALYAAAEPTTLTQTGLVVGTPRYMAPEQHRGEPGEAACDQYAFCLAMFEALYQRRPFTGETSGELLLAKTTEPLPSVARGEVPVRLHQAVARGLQPKPGDRWPSMADLLDELQAVAAPRRRSNVVAAGIVVTLGASGWLAFGGPQDVCASGEQRVAEVWNDATRSEVAGAFVEHSPVIGAATWERVGPTLDAYGASWAAAHRDACEATELRREQSAQRLDQRMQCLDGRLREMRALVGALQRADTGAVERAATAASELPTISNCAQAAYVQSQVPPPEDDGEARRVETVRDAIADANAMMSTGRFDAAVQSLEEIGVDVDETSYAPLRVEYLLAKGGAAWRQGDYGAGETLLREAMVQARRFGATRQATAAELSLTEVLAKLDRPDEALWLAELVEADAEREGDLDRQARVLVRRGTILSFRGDHAEAVSTLQRALALRQEHTPGSIPEGAAHNALGMVTYRAGDGARAMSELEAGLAIAREQLGPRHPHVASSLSNLSVVRRDVGELAESLANIDEALSIAQEVLGERHPSTAAYLDNRSSTLGSMGRHEEALVALQEALSIRLERLDAKSEKVAKTYNNIAVVQYHLGRLDEAIPNFRKALDIRTDTLGERHPETIKALSNFGGVLATAGRLDEAGPVMERAVAARVEVLGAEHADALVSKTNLAQIRIEQGRLVEARALADEVLEASKRVLPERHMDWGSVWRTQATLAAKEGRQDEAVAARRREVAAHEAVGQRGEVVAARLGLGKALAAAGADAEALEQLQQAKRDAGSVDVAPARLAKIDAAIAELAPPR